MHIVIMGCGRVGSALAQTLEQQGHTVAVDRPGPHGVPPARAPGSAAAGSPASASTRTPCARRASRRPAPSPRSAAATTPTSSPPGWPARCSASRTSRPASTTRAAPRSTSASASRRWPPSAGPPTRCCAGCCRRAPSRCGATRPAACSSPRCTRPPAWIGHKISKLQEETGVRVAFLTRLGEAILPTSQTVLQEGDLVHVMMRTDEVDEGRGGLRRGP